MKDEQPKFAPRDPETMAETGPQNHPLRGTVELVEGFAFTAPRRAVSAPAETPDTQLIVKRLRRKAEIMKLDAPRNSSLWYDLEEMLALVDLVGAQIGGSNG